MDSAVEKTGLDSAGTPASSAHVRAMPEQNRYDPCRAARVASSGRAHSPRAFSVLSATTTSVLPRSARRLLLVTTTRDATPTLSSARCSRMHHRQRVYWVVRNGLAPFDAAVTVAIVEARNAYPVSWAIVAAIYFHDLKRTAQCNSEQR